MSSGSLGGSPSSLRKTRGPSRRHGRGIVDEKKPLRPGGGHEGACGTLKSIPRCTKPPVRSR